MFEITLSDTFIQDAVLSGVEAYARGDGRRRRASDARPPGVETIGNIWGISWAPDDKTHGIRLERFSQSIAARRSQHAVLPDPHARRLARGVAARFSPHLRLIGDLHTHPYEDLDDVEQNKGWQFSEQDFRAFLADDDLWEWSDANPVMLVLTVCRLKRVHDSTLDWPQSNVWRFDVGEFRFWLNVCVGYMDDDGERCHTKLGGGGPRVHMGIPLYFNEAGARASI